MQTCWNSDNTSFCGASYLYSRTLSNLMTSQKGLTMNSRQSFYNWVEVEGEEPFASV